MFRLVKVYTKEELSKFSTKELQDFANLYDIKENETQKIIQILDSKFCTSINTFTQNIDNPYIYLSDLSLSVFCRYRNLKYKNKNRIQLIQNLLDDDVKTNHQFKRNVLTKNLFELKDPIEILLYGCVYNLDVGTINLSLFEIKQLIYIFMIMPKLNNYLNPLKIIPAFFGRISIMVKRIALILYYTNGIDTDFLNDEEVHQTFQLGYIPVKYTEYREREDRLHKLDNLPEWLKSDYFKDTNILEYVINTQNTKFEDALCTEKSIDKISEKIGLFIPTDVNDDKEYFLQNYKLYSKCSKNKDDLFSCIEKGTTKEYLSNLTDLEIFDQICFVHYKNRNDLIDKVCNLLNCTKNFFIKSEEQKDQNILVFSYGTYTNYIVYSNVQLESSFNRNKTFIKPGTSKDEFTIWEINELLSILFYYTDTMTPLIRIIANKLKK